MTNAAGTPLNRTAFDSGPVYTLLSLDGVKYSGRV